MLQSLVTSSLLMMGVQPEAQSAESSGILPAETEQMLSEAQQSVGNLLGGDVSGTNLMLLWSSVGWPVTKAIVLIIIAIIVSRWVGRIVASATSKARVEATLSKFFGAVARWLVLVLAALTILQTFGIQTTSFAAVVAAMGFAVGLALSGTLGNIAAGVMLLIFRPFKVGDFVIVNGISGTVDEIELFTTTLDTPDKRRLIIPNNTIFGSTIENISYHPVRRVDVNVGVEYAANVKRTREVLLDAVHKVEGVLEDPAPAAVLSELADSSVNWVVRVWVNAPDFWPVRERVTEAVKVSLDAARIGIPFPQREVWVRHANGEEIVPGAVPASAPIGSAG
jgi:small conductance mechanosensitive channel